MMRSGLRRAFVAGLIVLPCMAAQAADAFLPRTRAHIKCKFADGSYAEYKKKEKWYFYAEVIPHAQTTGSLNSAMTYVDEKGKRHEGVGTADLDCVGVGKRDGRVFWLGGFEDVRKQMMHFSWEPTKPNQIPMEGKPRAHEVPQLQAKLADLDAKEHVSATRMPMVVALDERQLLLEQPLTTLRHPNHPTHTVLYVMQSYSSDFGQSWSEPVLTKDAKLYEIGRTLGAQSWAPKPEVIVLDSSKRRR